LHLWMKAKMNKINNDGSKRGPCLLCGSVTQPFSVLIGHIREMHTTTHGTADLIARINDQSEQSRDFSKR
jgi:hypothetical protein